LHVYQIPMLQDLVKERVDDKKPRQEGLTYIIDKLQGLDKENFCIISPFIDLVKIYGAFPLLISNAVLEKKIKFYHEHSILVSTGSTITEYAFTKRFFERFVEESAKIGFDIIELGENSIDLTMEEKEKVVEIIKSRGLKYHWKIGKKDPRHQLGTDKTLEKIEEAMKVDRKGGADDENRSGNRSSNDTRGSNENTLVDRKVVIEANEGMGVGIYDEKGAIRWGFVGAITSKYPPNTFVFEAPLESQQSALIAEFGQRVNLAEISPNTVASVELQRMGIVSKAAYNISYLRKSSEGGPASKFVHYIIKANHPVEQSDLISLTHLPRRTIQSAIEELKEQGLIIEKNSLQDTRRKVYLPVQSEWL
jgi:phosphosulfolactate synthase